MRRIIKYFALDLTAQKTDKRNGFVFTEIAPDVQRKTLPVVIRGSVSLDSIIHSDGWRGHNGLDDVGFDKHYRLQTLEE